MDAPVSWCFSLWHRSQTGVAVSLTINGESNYGHGESFVTRY